MAAKRVAKRPAGNQHKLEKGSAREQQAIDMLLEGASSRTVAAKVGMSFSSIARFRREVVDPARARAAMSAGIVDDGRPETTNQIAEVTSQAYRHMPVLERVRLRTQAIETAIADTVENKDWSSMASVMRADQGYLTLEAKLTGELNEGTNTTNNYAVMLMPVRPSAAQLPEGLGDIIDVESS